jgi:hypothetical protein
MKTAWRSGLVLFVFLAPARVADADILFPRSEGAVLAQAALSDLAVTSAALDLGPASSYALSYEGVAQGSAWTGDLSGQFLGQRASGSLDGTISAPGASDPTFTLNSGSTIRIGNILQQQQVTYQLSGNLSYDDNADTFPTSGNLTFTARRAVAGTTIQWSNSSPLLVTEGADGLTLTGTFNVTLDGAKRPAATVTIVYTPSNPFTGGFVDTFTSRVTVGNTTRTINNGRATTTLSDPQSFNGAVNMDIASVPEPLTLVLAVIGSIGLAAHGWRKRKWLT